MRIGHGFSTRQLPALLAESSPLAAAQHHWVPAAGPAYLDQAGSQDATAVTGAHVATGGTYTDPDAGTATAGRDLIWCDLGEQITIPAGAQWPAADGDTVTFLFAATIYDGHDGYLLHTKATNSAAAAGVRLTFADGGNNVTLYYGDGSAFAVRSLAAAARLGTPTVYGLILDRGDADTLETFYTDGATVTRSGTVSVADRDNMTSAAVIEFSPAVADLPVAVGQAAWWAEALTDQQILDIAGELL